MYAHIYTYSYTFIEQKLSSCKWVNIYKMLHIPFIRKCTMTLKFSFRWINATILLKLERVIYMYKTSYLQISLLKIRPKYRLYIYLLCKLENREKLEN